MHRFKTKLLKELSLNMLCVTGVYKNIWTPVVFIFASLYLGLVFKWNTDSFHSPNAAEFCNIYA